MMAGNRRRQVTWRAGLSAELVSVYGSGVGAIPQGMPTQPVESW